MCRFRTIILVEVKISVTKFCYCCLFFLIMLFENFFTAIRLSQFKQVMSLKYISLLRMDGLISLKNDISSLAS